MTTVPAQPPIVPPITPDGTSWTARETITSILHRELLGPAGGPDELIALHPKQRYLVGRLAPVELGRSDERRTPEDELSGDADLDPDDLDLDASTEPDTDPTTGDDAATSDDAALRRGLIDPTSMGLRFQVGPDETEVSVTVTWGSYHGERIEEPLPQHQQPKLKPGVPHEPATRTRRRWRRTHHEHTAPLRLADLAPDRTTDVSVTDDVLLRVDMAVDERTGRRVIELALCSDRTVPQPIPVHLWLFQPSLTVAPSKGGSDAPFLSIRDPLVDPDPPIGPEAPDHDEVCRLELQYRDRLEFAVGRTCSATWELADQAGARAAKQVSTTWLPQAETPQVTAPMIEGAMLDMRALAVAEREQLREGLRPIVDGYREWLDAQATAAAALPDRLRHVADDAITEARRVHEQLADGVDLLADSDDPEVLRCFHFMNRVMADQRVHTQISGGRDKDSAEDLERITQDVDEDGAKAHSWRPFQLAFVLMQLRDLTDPTTQRRSGSTPEAQLLFFPTGGGKTEAYLGLAAYTFAIRRRQGVLDSAEGPLDGREGIAVIMRYTLRLLTAQQFQRAATLMCAAEVARVDAPEIWGDTPFRIGLWVGSGVTPKRVEEAAESVADAHAGYTKRVPVLQLRRCPWCGHTITPAQVRVDSAAGRVLVRCGDERGRCHFSEGGSVAEGIPVLTTDEEIYRLAPAFLVATVDKFARLAREGEAAALFGHVAERCERHGFVHPDSTSCTIAPNGAHQPKDALPRARRLPHGRLRPPDLIIQDELHLITGALGTTVGLFEVAIDVLASWTTPDGRPVRPLVVASSATVRNAAEQVRSLFARALTVFPPQVLDASETYFSTEIATTKDHPGRRYLGVTTPGVRLTVGEVRLAELLMSAAQLTMDTSGDAADPYMTLVGYFNTTRELAGMTRYLQDDVRTALRRGRPGVDLPRRYGTVTSELHAGELTARASGSDITSTLDQMATKFDAERDTTAARDALFAALRAGNKVSPPRKINPYDAVLATSMLQVGVDVTRLGLMMIVGQPKNTAEYIQASSRVGREPQRPGLVVTLGNWARPRDLAHYESFEHYHDRFYAQVEALSVTPFSITSMQRGLDGLFVSAARVLDAADASGASLSPEAGASRVDDRRAHLEELIERIVQRIAHAADEGAVEWARARLLNRLDQWSRRRAQVVTRQQLLHYEKVRDTSQAAPLIRSAESVVSRQDGGEAPFVVANSMREVQPEINLLVSPIKERLEYVPPPSAPMWQAAPPKDAS